MGGRINALAERWYAGFLSVRGGIIAILDFGISSKLKPCHRLCQNRDLLLRRMGRDATGEINIKANGFWGGTGTRVAILECAISSNIDYVYSV